MNDCQKNCCGGNCRDCAYECSGFSYCPNALGDTIEKIATFIETESKDIAGPVKIFVSVGPKEGDHDADCAEQIAWEVEQKFAQADKLCLEEWVLSLTDEEKDFVVSLIDG